MGILERFATIVKSNINDLLDKAEDPAKMVDQTLRELREELAEVRKETAGVMADAKKAQKDLDDCEAQISKFEKAAFAALEAGKEEDARTLLSRKQELEKERESLAQTASLAQSNAQKMRQMHDKLTADIETLESRKNTIKATNVAAKAQERMNKMVSGTDTASSLEAFDRMENKANARLASAMAEAELQDTSHPAEDLADTYLTGTASASVEEELAAMKEKLGKQVNGNDQ